MARWSGRDWELIMSYSNYRQIAVAIANLQEFQGSSAHAEWFNGVYTVYSYRTAIAQFWNKDNVYRFNADKYSVTTSKLQNIVRRAWANEDMEAM